MGGQGHGGLALGRTARAYAGPLETLRRPDCHVVTRFGVIPTSRGNLQPQIFSAVSTSTPSLRFSISSVIQVSIAAPENPQFGQMLRFSSGMNFAAPSTRYLMSSEVSTRGSRVLRMPRLMILFFGK